MGLVQVAHLGPTEYQVQSYMKFIWAINMGPLCNPRTIPIKAHFSAHFKPTLAPHINIGWVKAGTEMGLVHVAHLGPA